MVVRDPQLRSDRVLWIRSIDLAQLVGSEAQKLQDSTLVIPCAYIGGPVDVEMRPCLAGRANVLLYVDSSASQPASSRVVVPALCAVGLKLNGSRVRMWRPMP